jgi:hypothetical protein
VRARRWRGLFGAGRVERGRSGRVGALEGKAAAVAELE